MIIFIFFIYVAIQKFFIFLLLFPAAPLAAVRPYAVIARPVLRLVVAIRVPAPAGAELLPPSVREVSWPLAMTEGETLYERTLDRRSVEGDAYIAPYAAASRLCV